jgi:hypothetical protein
MNTLQKRGPKPTRSIQPNAPIHWEAKKANYNNEELSLHTYQTGKDWEGGLMPCVGEVETDLPRSWQGCSEVPWAQHHQFRNRHSPWGNNATPGESALHGSARRNKQESVWFYLWGKGFLGVQYSQWYHLEQALFTATVINMECLRINLIKFMQVGI